MSGKKIKAARRATKSKKSVVESAPRSFELAAPPVTLKLDLACGQNCQPDYEGVDLPSTPGVKHGVDLTKFPWPWADNSVLELHSSHFVEHLPMEFVDDHGNYVPCGTPGSRDLFFRFFDECYRILVPDGWITIIVPCVRSNRAFQDPTHRRFLPAETFFYLSKNWRESQKLDHYNVSCNFDGPINPGIFSDQAQLLQARNDEVRSRMMNGEWNIIGDWHAKLRAIKTPPMPTSLPLSVPAAAAQPRA